jgi:hypothetical protein
MSQTITRVTKCDVKNCTQSASVSNEQPPEKGWGVLHLTIEGRGDIFKNVCPEHAGRILEEFFTH